MLFLVLIASLIASMSGCGYHTAGHATHLPATVHVLDVPIFKNRTQAYHVELSMTQAVLKAFASRTSYRVVSTDDTKGADAVLQGTVTAFTIYPLTYDSTTNQSSSYEITITARVSLTDRDGRVLYHNDRYVFREQYESTQDLVSFIQEDSAAVKRISRDFAQNLVADVTEGY